MSCCVSNIALSPGKAHGRPALRRRPTFDFRDPPRLRNPQERKFASDRSDLAVRRQSLRSQRENALQYNQSSTQALEFAAPGTSRKREDDSYPLASSLMVQTFALTDIGCVRRNNEDVVRLDDDLGLYVIADGMGGAQAGEVAANLAAEAVLQHFRQNPARSADTLRDAFEQAHCQVLSAAAHDPEWRGMGCTLVAALCERESIYLANVGDSRAYVFEGGRCEFVTSDQTWVNEVGRKLGLPEEELKKHPLHHVLTVAVGAEGAFRVNSETRPLNQETRILLCTDGLHDVVSDADITDVMASKRSADWKCHLLVEAAREAGGPDNITVAVLQNGS